MTLGFSLNFIICKIFEKRRKEKYKADFKALIENYIALNVSHLHDAANIFNLIKINSQEQNIINFATSSAFHFRSLFNSLKKSLLEVKRLDPESLSEKNLYQLIEKEDLDLKDLINLELFQLGNFSRIELDDQVEKQFAMIYGNFELLSKVFLNLVENALKYADSQIKIELNETASSYQLKIISFGKSISTDISLSINNKIYERIEGHGLSSLVDIMNYHHAEVHVLSLESEGSSICLEFKKAEFQQKPSNTAIAESPRKKPQVLLFIAILVFLGSTLGIFKLTNISQSKKGFQAEDLKTQAILDSMIDEETQKLGLSLDL